MALGHAKAQFIGNLTRDIELRNTPSGKLVGSFTLAVNSTKDSVGYFNFDAWEKTAELIDQYTQKGDRIFIEARVDYRSWEKDGQKRNAVFFTVENVTFLQLKDKPEFSKQEYSDTHEFNKRQADVVIDDFDDKPITLDDIPF